MRNQFGIMATITEKLVGMGFLKVVAADLLARNLRGDGQHRHSAAVAIIKAVDQMHVAWPATSGANGQFTRQVGLSTCGKRRRLFVAHADPFNLIAPADLLQDAVKRVADDTANPCYTCRDQSFDQDFCYSFLLHNFVPCYLEVTFR